MKLSCLQENLSKGLAIVGRAVATRTTLPITQNVLLTTDGGRLRLSATNLEIAITTWVGASVEEEGSLSVPARLLTEFVGSLPAGQIDIASMDRPKSIQLKSGRFDARINGTDAEEFPPIPSVDQGTAVKIKSRILRAAVGQTVFAAATEESRPVLTGVKLEIVGDHMTMAAADGFRLAVHRGKTEEPVGDSVSVIIPARTLNEVSRMLEDGDSLVQVMVAPGKAQAMFRLENIEVVSQLIQGNFPPYSDLVNDAMKGTKAKAEVALPELLQASRSASIFARDSSNIVRIQVTPGSPGQLTVSSRAEEVGENVGEVECAVEGEESKIAFNSKYLLDVLQAMGGDKVWLETSGPSRAGVFRLPGSDQYIHLVMPMFVQW
jgi:DNA polymerase-3 subunit beta